jgi:uncharacterized protein YndB with AHSA1/START domain
MTTIDRPRRDFTLSWTLDSPPADVFRAWTEPDQLDWFYNDQQPIPSDPIELDLRIGGVWRQKMVIDQDTAYFTGGVYREIVTDEKLVFTWGATDGWPEIDPERLDDSPLVTVTFAETDGGTHMSVRVEVPETLVDDHKPGWWSMVENGMRDTVDRLAARLAASTTAV